MAKNTSLSRGDHFAGLIDRQVMDGRYGSAREVVRAGLRLLEEHAVKVATPQAALVAGEESGPAEALNSQAFLQAMRAEYGC